MTEPPPKQVIEDTEGNKVVVVERPSRMRKWMGNLWQALLYAALAALLTLGSAFLLSGPNQERESRTDANVQTILRGLGEVEERLEEMSLDNRYNILLNRCLFLNDADDARGKRLTQVVIRCSEDVTSILEDVKPGDDLPPAGVGPGGTEEAQEPSTPSDGFQGSNDPAPPSGGPQPPETRNPRDPDPKPSPTKNPPPPEDDPDARVCVGSTCVDVKVDDPLTGGS